MKMITSMRKFALSFCAILLLNESANASFLDGLQNVMTQIQKKQQTSSTGNSLSGNNSPEQQTTSEIKEEATPTFNSLAEEEAYKKQQKVYEQQMSSDLEQNFKKNIIPKIEQIESMRFQFYKKYYVRDNDTLDSIDSKFKNRIQLFQEKQKDLKAHDTEVNNLQQIFDKNYNDPKAKVFYINMLQEQKIKFPIIIATDTHKYDAYFLDNSGNKYVGYYDSHINYDAESYGDYLKDAYTGYEQRQQEIQQVQANNTKQIQRAKEAKAQQAQWEKENKKVRGICNAWIAKAHKQVYSLGVGDRIRHNGTNYTIQEVNANTFVGYHMILKQMYLKKSECLPEVMPAAPSQYCQSPQ